jgi:hypothetical protein
VRRRLLNLMTALSLVVCLAAAGIWIVSYPLTSPKGRAQPSTAAILTQLSRPLPQVNFSGVALHDAISFMEGVSGVEIDVDWAALEAAAVPPNTTVNLPASNIRLGEALAALLGPHGVVYVTRCNALYVTTRTLHDRDPLFAGVGRGAPPAPDSRVREKIIGGRRWTVAADGGVLRVWCTPADPASVYQRGGSQAPPPRSVSGGTHIFGDFAFGRTGYPLKTVEAHAPFWALTLLAALLPLLRLGLAVRRARQKPPGHCQRCGYDLRATPDRCPECGTAATTQA